MKLLKYPQDAETIRKVIKCIDYSDSLNTDATQEDVVKSCDEAIKYGFAAVAVFPINIPIVAKRLENYPIHAQIPVGFPCGNHYTEVKLLEAKMGLEYGAQEVDMVMNISKFMSGEYNYIQDELGQMVMLAEKYGVEVKMIIEVNYLNDEQKLKACDLAIAGGAKFVKTCTGTTIGRATLHDICLMKDHVGDKIKLKASSGVASLEDALGFINAGASRSAGRYNMVEQLEKIGYNP